MALEHKYSIEQVTFTPFKAWALVPPEQSLALERSSPCFTMLNPMRKLLYPNIINYIYLGLKVKLPYGYVLQVRQNDVNNPWHILDTFLHHDNLQHSCLAPLSVITSLECKLSKGDLLTQLQLVPICSIQPPILRENTYYQNEYDDDDNGL